MWSAPLPASLKGKPVRNLYIGGAENGGGTRLTRTRSSAAEIGLLPAQRTAEGIETTSSLPLQVQPTV